MSIKWPLVRLSTYKSLLRDYLEQEDHYWVQARFNISAQDRIRGLEHENKKLKEQVEKLKNGEING